VFGDAAVAAAMINRRVHNAEVVLIKGDSCRLKDRNQTGLNLTVRPGPNGPGQREQHRCSLSKVEERRGGWQVAQGEFTISLHTKPEGPHAGARLDTRQFRMTNIALAQGAFSRTTIRNPHRMHPRSAQ
jgi:hypothetical protein